MTEVNKTLYIPLYGKAFVSRKGIILRDAKAEEIWVFWLSESLNGMSEADLIWFVDGWQHSKGCTIEHLCASLYGIETEFETLATRRDGSYKYGKQ